jgi:hypothetical protein
VNQITQTNKWPLINPKLSSKRNYKNSGELVFVTAKVEKGYSFLEYIQGGFKKKNCFILF